MKFDKGKQKYNAVSVQYAEILPKVRKRIDKANKVNYNLNQGKTKLNKIKFSEAPRRGAKENKMQREEFEKLTGIYPSYDLYHAIENEYMAIQDGALWDKEVFCKAYKKNADGLARKIQNAANVAMLAETANNANERRRLSEEIKKLEKKVQALQKQLEREEEWKPAAKDTKMDDDEYEELNRDQDADHMADHTAANWIERETGFPASIVKIAREVDVMEVNRHHVLRTVGTVKRDPLYSSTDWNYCRFTVKGYVYEIVNGDLYLL